MSKLPWADKKLGQHFLVNQSVIQKITEDFKDQADWIIEVGPGPGVLTKHLFNHQLPLFAVDKDQRFKELLLEFVLDERLFITDALDFPLEDKVKDWSSEFGKKGWLVSNLPYNVSSPLLIKFLPIEELQMMTLMFQKEVADKVFKPDDKKMNSLRALSTTFFKVKQLCKVSPGSFQPPPKVNSAVLTFERIENPQVPLSEFSQFESFLRKIFSGKRKQMGSFLKSFFAKEAIERAFLKLDIPLSVRAETFNLDQIHILYKELK